MQSTPNCLAELPAAEAGLAVAIRTAASAVDEIATHTLDNALVRLEESVRACHGRLGAAMGKFRQKIGEVVETIEALAASIFEDLGSDANLERVGIDPTTLETIGQSEPERQLEPVVSAPIAELPAAPGTDVQSQVGEFPPELSRIEPAVPVADDHAITLTAKPFPNAHEARQDTPDAEATHEPACASIASQQLPYASAACPPVHASGKDDRKPAPSSPRPRPTVPAPKPATTKKGRRRPRPS